MCTEAVTGSAAIAGPCGLVTGFHGLLEPLQVLGPELGEEVPQRGEPFRPHRVQAPLAVRAHSHQARVPEHLQVQGEGLLAHEIAATTGASPDQLAPRIIAATVLGTMRALWERGLAQLATGRPQSSPAMLRDDLDKAFGLLAGGLGDYGRT